MNLNEHIHQVISRSRSFFTRKEPGYFLIQTTVPFAAPEIPPLYDFNLDEQLELWLEYKLQVAREKWRSKLGLDDDTIPAICPTFGIAEHSAWLGLDVQLQQDTCLPVPVPDWKENIDSLQLNSTNKWFQYMKRGYDFLRRQQDGSFLLSIRGTMCPMDLANAICGDDLFLDFVLNPQDVHQLMTFLVPAIKWYYGHLCNWADRIDSGYVMHLGNSWIGPGFLGHISNDAAFLCSAAIYQEFGFPYEYALVKDFKNVLYHVHNEKMQFVPQVTKLPNLSLLEISIDPKTNDPIEELSNIYDLTGNANLMLHATSEQVRKHIYELKTRNVLLDIQCPDRADAQDIIQFVRSHSKPL